MRVVLALHVHQKCFCKTLFVFVVRNFRRFFRRFIQKFRRYGSSIYLCRSSIDFCGSSADGSIRRLSAEVPHLRKFSKFLRKFRSLCVVTTLFGTRVLIPLPLPLFEVTRTSVSKSFSPRASKHLCPISL